ncbi:aldo/keto reductase [Phenylobacterium sp.]|uniref:aldo/keto reductase n=1 Tax=Phenylobacterium sp. TaxID=1871053 RepID=UPI0035B48804
MRYRPLGATGLAVSEIGFGAASYWGLRRFDEARALSLVHAALDGGITFFDTGAAYSRGEAEPRLGRALKGRATDDLVVATKAGTRHAGGRTVRDFSPAAVVASAEASLKRLGLERLALLQLHGPAAVELTDDLLEALERLRERGLVRAFGVNSFDPAVIEHVIGLPTFDAVMIDYNVLRPEREPLIARAAAAGKGVLAGMALAMGHPGRQALRLRGPQDVWYALRALKNHRADIGRGARFSFLEQTPGMTGAQAALAFVLANPHVACAVTGTTRLAHLEANMAASGLVLPDEVMARVRQVQAGLSS